MANEKLKSRADEEHPEEEDDEDEFNPLMVSKTGADEDEDNFCERDNALVPGTQHRRIILFACVGGFLFGCAFGSLAYRIILSHGGDPVPEEPHLSDTLPTNSPSLGSTSRDPIISENETQTAPDPAAPITSQPTTNPTTQPTSKSSIPEQQQAPPMKVYKTFQSSWNAIAESMQVYTPHPYPARCNMLCKELRNIDRPNNNNAELVYNITSALSCGAGFGGTGNKVLEYVGHRLAALAEGNTSLVYDCGPDAFDKRRGLVTPWLSGYFPRLGSRRPWDMIFPTNVLSHGEMCPSPPPPQSNNTRRRLNPGNTMPLKFMIPLINHDLRRMAVALVGVPDPNHPSAEFEKTHLRPESMQPPFTPTAATGAVYKIPIHEYYENGPFYKDVQLDDAVIHFRCGDVLTGAYGPFYYPKYEEYTRIISQDVRTIGIVTQAFSIQEGVQARHIDKIERSGGRCKVLVMGLVEYMQAKLPQAKITVHNGPDETLSLAFARLIMANQTLGLIPSTFSTFPVIASFGTGYVTKARGKASTAGYFLNHKLTRDIYKDVPVEVDIMQLSTMMYCQTLNKTFGEENGAEKVLEWFQTDTKRSSN